MASTGAVLYVKPYGVAAASVGRGSGAVMLVTSRLLSGVMVIGVTDSANRSGSDSWLPSAQAPIGYVIVGGQRLPVHIDPMAWYRFFTTIADVRLGGFSGNTLPDVVTTVEAAQSSAVQSAANVASVVTQSQTNAEALSAAVQVIRNNALTGADQIPPVSLTPYQHIP